MYWDVFNHNSYHSRDGIPLWHWFLFNFKALFDCADIFWKCFQIFNVQFWGIACVGFGLWDDVASCEWWGTGRLMAMTYMQSLIRPHPWREHLHEWDPQNILCVTQIRAHADVHTLLPGIPSRSYVLHVASCASHVGSGDGRVCEEVRP